MSSRQCQSKNILTLNDKNRLILNDNSNNKIEVCCELEPGHLGDHVYTVPSGFANEGWRIWWYEKMPESPPSVLTGRERELERTRRTNAILSERQKKRLEDLARRWEERKWEELANWVLPDDA